MTTCPPGKVYSYNQKKCLTADAYQVYIEQLALDRNWDAISLEQNKGKSNTGFDPLGVNTFFDRIGQNIVKILVIGGGLALIGIAGYGYVTGSSIKLELPK